MRNTKPYTNQLTGINYVLTPREVGPHSKFKVIPEHYEAFKPHPHFTEITVARCLATNRRNKLQCNALSVKGVACCRIHGGKAGAKARTPEAHASIVAGSITHGRRQKAVVEAKTKLVKSSRALAKIAQIVGIQPYTRPCNKTLTAADIPKLLEDIKI